MIERELLGQEDISRVYVSHAKKRISIESAKEYTPREIQGFLEKHEYRVGGVPDKACAKKRPLDWKRVGAAAVFTLALYLVLDMFGVLRLSPSSAAPVSLAGIFVIGLIASLSSCTAVVGGLVAAVSSAVAKDQVGMRSQDRLRPHILFNAGRILGFFGLGAVIGLFGSSIQLSPGLNGVFIVIVAALMIVIGVNLMDVLPSPVLGMPKWMAHNVHDLAESRDPKAPMLLGAMTFFLPCGFTQSMQLFALTLQDPIQSGLVMAVFALGTTPVLLGIGSATSFSSGEKLKQITQFAGVVVLILGISNAGNGLALLGVNPGAALASSDADVVIEDGRQQIEMKMTSRGLYEPDVLVVDEGVPVDWMIYGDDFMGCGDSLILPAFGVNEILRSGPNLVTFVPDEPGRYTFSCSMGMIRGTMLVNPA